MSGFPQDSSNESMGTIAVVLMSQAVLYYVLCLHLFTITK